MHNVSSIIPIFLPCFYNKEGIVNKIQQEHNLVKRKRKKTRTEIVSV